MIDSFIDAAWSKVLSDLNKRHIKHIDYFMLTHWHIDHCGNIINLINNGFIDSNTIVYLPQKLDESASGSTLPADYSEVLGYESSVLSAFSSAGIAPVRPSEGDTVIIDECELKFWNADHSVYYPGQTYASSNYNDWSLCAYLTVGNTIICFTGDIGPIGMTKMISLGTMHKANIMTSPHHGWTNGSFSNGYGLVPGFINAVLPDIVFTEDCNAHANYIDTINSPIQTWCQKNGVGNYRTYINGSMDIQIGQQSWEQLGNYKSYITNESDWNWYDMTRELMIDAQIKAASKDYANKYYSNTNGAGVLHNAVEHITGASDTGENTYNFHLRVIDSGNSDAFIEAIVTGYRHNSSTGTTTYIRKRAISISAQNNMGTIALSGVVGTPYFVIEMM